MKTISTQKSILMSHRKILAAGLAVCSTCRDVYAYPQQNFLSTSNTKLESISQPPVFRENSIYRPSQGTWETQDAASEEPGYHLFDNFGKDSPMPGIATFAHTNWTNCRLAENDESFDIGIVGMPFDLGVSYRPGQRFGPIYTRTASQRMGPSMSYRYG